MLNRLIDIKQMQAFDIKYLISNIGGYVGLLLGWALVRLPDFVFDTFELATDMLAKWKIEQNAKMQQPQQINN